MRPLLTAALLTSVFLSPLTAGTGRRGAADGPPDLRITPAEHLAAGRFEWEPERSPSGNLGVVVSLPRQMLYVYRGGVLIARSSVSSGRPGHSTPSGLFQILGKEVMHHSNLYDNAPMPWMQRLTMEGVALHAGYLPGSPASHGCVRLPPEFAKRLFTVTACGDPVLIAGKAGDVVEQAGWQIPSQLSCAISARQAGAPPVPAPAPPPPKPVPTPALAVPSIAGSEPKNVLQPAPDIATAPTPPPSGKTLSQLEEEELRIRKDPSLDRVARSRALLNVWTAQRALTGER